MPKDPAGRCAVSIHYYTPSTFCILTEDASWGKAQTEWGTDAELLELYNNLDMMKENFIDKGIPVIMGEYGVAAENKTTEQINNFLTTVAASAYARDICPVLWDITSKYSIYDRYSCKMSDSELEAAYREIAGGKVTPPEVSSSEAESSEAESKDVSETESLEESSASDSLSSADTSTENVVSAASGSSAASSNSSGSAKDPNPSTGGGIALTGLILLSSAALVVKKKK